MASGKPSWNIYEKRRLAMTGDESLEAVAFRLTAARLAFNYEQFEIRLSRGLFSSDLLDVQAAEAGLRPPRYFHLSFFWVKHRIRDEFFTEGEISLLPADVELPLYSRLSSS